MSKRRVVITGLGCITALAETAEELFDAILPNHDASTIRL